MKFLLSASILLALGGCMPTIIYRDRIKEVPVLVFNDPPKAAPVEYKLLPIHTLKSDSSDSDTASAAIGTIIQLKSENEQLRATIEPFQDNKQ